MSFFVLCNIKKKECHNSSSWCVTMPGTESLPLPKMQPLQISALVLFVPCACFAHMHHATIMAVTLWCVVASSLIVHRADRAATDYDAYDVADSACIAAWVANCAWLMANLAGPRAATRQLYAFLFHLLVYFFNYVRQRAGPYKSRPRRFFHVCMHMSGVFGTLFLVQWSER